MSRGRSAGHNCCLNIFHDKCLTIKCLTLRLHVMFIEYNIRNSMANINRQLKMSSLGIFFSVALIRENNIFYLENLGQGYGVQHLQWRHSMANIRF